MRILVQWALSDPSDWEEIESAHWHLIPSKEEPQGNEVLDNQKGWINCINIQGICFSADHYHIEHVDDDEIKITIWNDDLEDWDEGDFFAQEITVKILSPDDKFGGAYNTQQEQTLYLGENIYDKVSGKKPEKTTVKKWKNFKAPEESIRHGIWLQDEQYDAHLEVQTQHGWREWVDGVPEHLLDKKGKLKDQRLHGKYSVPDGTKTYYHNATPDITQSVETSEYSHTLGLNPNGAVSEVSGNASNNGSVEWWSATIVGQPNSAQWPTGNYRHQIDVTSVPSTVEYGLLQLGASGNGYFGRVNTGLTSLLESHPQQEAAFIFTGLKLATTGSVSWSAGSVDDRFAISVAMIKMSGHGQQKMTVQLGEFDDFADGPWEVVQDLNGFFGCNS